MPVCTVNSPFCVVHRYMWITNLKQSLFILQILYGVATRVIVDILEEYPHYLPLTDKRNPQYFVI